MPQTKEGAGGNDWIVYMKRCAEAYHKNKAAAGEKCARRCEDTTSKAKAAKTAIHEEEARGKRIAREAAKTLEKGAKPGTEDAVKARQAKQQVDAEKARKKRVASEATQKLKAETAALAKAKKIQQAKHREEVHENVEAALRRTPGPATKALKDKQARQAG